MDEAQCLAAYNRMRDDGHRDFELLYDLSRENQYNFAANAATGNEWVERVSILQWLALSCLKHALLSFANNPLALELAPWLGAAHPDHPTLTIWEVICSDRVTLATWRQLIPGPHTHPDLWAAGWCFPIPHSKGAERSSTATCGFSQYGPTFTLPALGGGRGRGHAFKLLRVCATLNSGPPTSPLDVASHRLNGFLGSARDCNPHNLRWEVCLCAAASRHRLRCDRACSHVVASPLVRSRFPSTPGVLSTTPSGLAGLGAPPAATPSPSSSGTPLSSAPLAACPRAAPPCLSPPASAPGSGWTAPRSFAPWLSTPSGPL